jgi:rhodanese-related sulfurtransferase
MQSLRLIVLCFLGCSLLPVTAADEPKAKPATPAKPSSASKVRNVGVEEFDKLRADKSNVVLDVRTAPEFERGHIPGAVNLDFNSSDFAKKVGELDKDKTYLVHCAAGVRSAKACGLMDKADFKHLINLEPGFRAWEKAGKPVEKK